MSGNEVHSTLSFRTNLKLQAVRFHSTPSFRTDLITPDCEIHLASGHSKGLEASGYGEETVEHTSKHYFRTLLWDMIGTLAESLRKQWEQLQDTVEGLCDPYSKVLTQSGKLVSHSGSKL